MDDRPPATQAPAMRRFLRWFAAALALALALAGGLATLVDPYDYWGAPRVSGVNAARGAANTHLGWVKERQYARGRWSTIVAGNSRVQVGFDPASAAWPVDARPVYNLGLAGRSAADAMAAVETAIAVRRPRAVYLGVDLIDFRVTREAWRAWRPSAGPGPPSLTERAGRVARVSLSLTALGDTLASLAGQRAADPADITPAGYNALAEYRRVVADEGHFALFEQRNRENYRNYAAGAKAVRWPGPGGSDAWAALDRLAAVCRAKGVRLVVFTYPYHADILAGFERAGLLPALLDFKRALAAFGARAGVEVWDFARLNAASAEPVPPPGDRATRLGWYWEAGHFKAAMGDAMIAAMTGGAKATPIGARIDGAAADDRLADQLAALRAADPAATARREASFAAVERAR